MGNRLRSVRIRVEARARNSNCLPADAEAARGSDGEGGAAAAGRGRVRIVDLEGRADQFVHIVDFRSRKIGNRNGIDQHPHAVPFDHEVVIRLRVVQRESILETGAAAALHGHAQNGALVLSLKDFGNLLGCPFREGDRGFCRCRLDGRAVRHVDSKAAVGFGSFGFQRY